MRCGETEKTLCREQRSMVRLSPNLRLRHERMSLVVTILDTVLLVTASTVVVATLASLVWPSTPFFSFYGQLLNMLCIVLSICFAILHRRMSQSFPPPGTSSTFRLIFERDVIISYALCFLLAWTVCSTTLSPPSSVCKADEYTAYVNEKEHIAVLMASIASMWYVIQFVSKGKYCQRYSVLQARPPRRILDGLHQEAITAFHVTRKVALPLLSVYYVIRYISPETMARMFTLIVMRPSVISCPGAIVLHDFINIWSIGKLLAVLSTTWLTVFLIAAIFVISNVEQTHLPQEYLASLTEKQIRQVLDPSVPDSVKLHFVSRLNKLCAKDPFFCANLLKEQLVQDDAMQQQSQRLEMLGGQRYTHSAIQTPWSTLNPFLRAAFITQLNNMGVWSKTPPTLDKRAKHRAQQSKSTQGTDVQLPMLTECKLEWPMHLAYIKRKLHLFFQQPGASVMQKRDDAAISYLLGNMYYGAYLIVREQSSTASPASLLLSTKDGIVDLPIKRDPLADGYSLDTGDAAPLSFTTEEELIQFYQANPIAIVQGQALYLSKTGNMAFLQRMYKTALKKSSIFLRKASNFLRQRVFGASKLSNGVEQVGVSDSVAATAAEGTVAYSNVQDQRALSQPMLLACRIVQLVAAMASDTHISPQGRETLQGALSQWKDDFAEAKDSLMRQEPLPVLQQTLDAASAALQRV
eukprot:m.91602 g.91602  ORF g.91602 m.91602 type:complete len:693 (-) comp12952_c0_seq2:63-2141(-)